MSKSLRDWDVELRYKTGSVPAEKRTTPGSWLPVIPSREEWDEFLIAVRQDWRNWQCSVDCYELALLVLYHGTAFFEYEGGAFWEAFAKATGEAHRPDPSRQTTINQAFARVCVRLGLPIHQQQCGTAYVGSAVYHVGIPVKVWDGFLAVCEWAWGRDWESLSEEEWAEKMSSVIPGKQRLQRFMVKNRETAAKWIREMHDLRKVLAQDSRLALEDIAGAVFLRREYFDEVPETADFLREKDPDSLFRDRPRLFWDEERSSIQASLPRVDGAKLPAHWSIGSLRCCADTSPVGLRLDAAAFVDSLSFCLTTTTSEERQRVQGLGAWALYDEVRKRFVNASRDTLPLSTYALVSRQPLNFIGRTGWIQHDDEPADNTRYELQDGTPCYVTRLYPAASKATLQIEGKPKLVFQQRQKVVLRAFSQTSSHRFRFSFGQDQVLHTETWPRIVLEMPVDFVSEDELHREFHVFMDGQRAMGKWCEEENDGVLSYWFWKWADAPVPAPGGEAVTIKDLKSLPAKPPPRRNPWLGQHKLYVESQRIGRISFGKRSTQEFELLESTPDWLWPQHAGEFLVWVLLAQVQDEATWEEIKIAKNEVAAFQSTSLQEIYYQLRKIERAGMMIRRGRLWTDFESRIWFAHAKNGKTRAEFAGLPSVIYPVLREALPADKIAIPRSHRGNPPHMELRWASHDEPRVRQLCQANGIHIMKDGLWNR